MITNLKDIVYRLNQTTYEERLEAKFLFREMSLNCGMCDDCAKKYAIIQRYNFHEHNRRHQDVYDFAEQFVNSHYGDDGK